MSIFLPDKTNFILVKTKYREIDYQTLVIYNIPNYIMIVIKHIIFYKYSRTLLINSKNYVSVFIASNYLTNYIYTWNTFFYKKIKFKGKGYKILRRRRLLKLTFNKSHITWMFFFKILFQRLAKQKYIFISKNYKYLSQLIQYIYMIRPFNIFTKRGIRLSQQKIFKKIGKRTT